MRSLKITSSITRRDEKSIEKYLTEISRYDVLSPEEEVNLFKKIKNGDEDAIQQVVNHNLRFVVSVAKKYQNLGLSLGDLINEGNIGLLKAARRFDETKGFKFISYAVWWIRQSILQAVNDKARKIRVPLNLQGATRKIIAKRIEFLQQEEREPTMAELAEATELRIDVVQKSLETYKKCTSLDAPLGEDSENSMLTVMGDDEMKAPDHELDVLESQKQAIQQMLSSVTARQAQVLTCFYGIDRKHPMSLEDIGDELGISRERVRQIKDRAVRSLRQNVKRHEVAVM